MSLYSYIHEYDDYDAAILAAHNLQKDVAVAMFEYEQAEQLAMKKVMFESANYDVLMEEARENVFVKIGKALTNLVKKIGEFLKGIFDKVFNRKKNQEREKNIAIAKQFLAKHPEQRDTVIAAMERGDMELKDVAQYARDVEQVIKLAERQDLEADTLNNKVNEVCKKIDNAAPINVAKTLGTIGAAVGGVVVLYKGLGDLTGMITDIKDYADKKSKVISDLGIIRGRNVEYITALDDKNKFVAKKNMEDSIKAAQNHQLAVEQSRLNALGKLISKLIPAARGYKDALNQIDEQIFAFNQQAYSAEADEKERKNRQNNGNGGNNRNNRNRNNGGRRNRRP